MQAFKVILVIVFLFLLIAISTPANSTVAIPPTGLEYRDCGNHIYARASDTLNAIAARCGMTLSALEAANPNLPPNGDQLLGFGTKVMMPAQQVTIVRSVTIPSSNPAPQTIIVNPSSSVAAVPSSAVPVTGGSVYTIQAGDTLFKIAQQYHTTVNALLQLNPTITNPDLIYAGQVLVVP